jgi:hypothetical protein
MALEAVPTDVGGVKPVGVGTVEYFPVRVHVPPAGKRPVLGWGLALLPPLAAVLCWPVFFAIFFVMSFTLALMAVTGCLIWAWRVSDRLATWRYWRRARAGIAGEGRPPRAGYRGQLRMSLFVAQAVGVLSSCPIFWWTLTLFRQHGISPQFFWVGRRLVMAH